MPHAARIANYFLGGKDHFVYVDNDPLVLVRAHALPTSSPPGVTDSIEADAGCGVGRKP